MNANSILRWAAGANVALPTLTCPASDVLLELMGVSTDELVLLLKEHHLTQRFLLRVFYERPIWCGPQLLMYLAQENEQTQLHLQKQIDALNEIAAALCVAEGSDISSLVLIKGHSLFALSGQMHHQRHAGDLDVLAADADLLWDVLGELGFERKRHYTHEFGKAKRGEVVVDVHNFYPVPSYPCQNEKSSNSSLAANFTVPPHCQSAALTYKELRRYCFNGRTSRAQAILVPQPTALAFILVAHLFRNYVERPHFNSPNLGVRLGELTDVVELFHHPDFDNGLFLDLVERCQAHDAFAFVRLMAREHLGFLLLQQSQVEQEQQGSARTARPVEPPQLQQPQSPLSSFPESLFWGGWLAIDEVVHTLQMRDLATLLRQVGATSTVVSHTVFGEVDSATSKVTNNEATTLKPFLHKNESVPLRMGVCNDWESINLRISGLKKELLPCCLRLHLGSKNRITIDIGTALGWTTAQKDCVPELRDFCAVESCSSALDEFDVMLKIPLASLVFVGKHKLAMPLIIGLKTYTPLGRMMQDDSANVNYYGCYIYFDYYNTSESRCGIQTYSSLSNIV